MVTYEDNRPRLDIFLNVNKTILVIAYQFVVIFEPETNGYAGFTGRGK